MLASFYRHRARLLVGLLCLSFPYVLLTGESIGSNNDIETWLPGEAPVRSVYDNFKERFGAEELIVIGLPGDESQQALDESLVEAVCQRLEALPGIRTCWSPYRLAAIMEGLGVEPDEALRRLEGLSMSPGDGGLIGIAALLSPEGLQDRAGTVADVRTQLRYCQLGGEHSQLAGSPVVVAELDRLGSRQNNKQFFLVTLLICLVLLYWTLRDWKLTAAILGLTVWAINMTLTTLAWSGVEMNFILGALPVMVMVFTLAISVHLVHYYRTAIDGPDPLNAALRLAWKPCCLATLTTSIGLGSLVISDIAPVRQFGVAGAVGSLVALVTGLGLVPVLLTLLPPRRLPGTDSQRWIERVATGIVGRSGLVALVTLVLIIAAGIGLPRLRTKIDPIDFLPTSGQVRQDVALIERDLTSTSTLEAVVDFGNEELSFVEKLDRVRQIEESIGRHPRVRHTMSLAKFFPETMPEGALETLSLLKRARGQSGGSDYVADGERSWRISVRVRGDQAEDRRQTYDELVAATAGMPLEWTGIGPLLDHAQREIFRGFWESFLTAFGIITLVMIISLRSPMSGLVAMIPNLTPILIVFGVLGWTGWYVDIGMMMSGSIALGIAVDGTFHFLVRYHEQRRTGQARRDSSHVALVKTGPPILQAAIVAGTGMLALALSQFVPTARFGVLTATMLVTALVGDLVLLPALLALGCRGQNPKRRQTTQRRRPHFLVLTEHHRGNRSRTSPGRAQAAGA